MKSGMLLVALLVCGAGANRRHLHRLRHVHKQPGDPSLEWTRIVADLGNKKCQCIGFDGLQGKTKAVLKSDGKDVVVPYPADIGSGCKAWDDGYHPFCKGAYGSADPRFCKDKWCYVNPKDCDIPVIPKASTYMPKATFQTLPVFYSYATCGAKDKYTEEVSAVGLDACRCVGFADSPGMTIANIRDKKVDYPAEIGGTCKAWDAGHHPDCVSGDEQPDWCEKPWCYVDPCSCTGIAQPQLSAYLNDGTFQNKPIFWSYATCGAVDSYSTEGDLEESKKTSVSACRDDKSTDAKVFGKPKCPCIGFDGIDGETVAAANYLGLTTDVSYPADLGGTCDSWDADSHPSCKGANVPEWCRASWCYVDARDCSMPILPKRSAYQPAASYQDLPLYYSYSTCGSEDTWTQNAPDVGQQGCRCIGIDGIPGSIPMFIDAAQVDYPAETGGQCKTWDGSNHPKCTGDEFPEWCSKKWCYVDPCSCNTKVPPKISAYLGYANFQAKTVFWSYATCGYTDTYSTAEQQAVSKAEIKKLCSAAKPVAATKIWGFAATKSGAHGLTTILTVAALCLSFSS